LQTTKGAKEGRARGRAKEARGRAKEARAKAKEARTKAGMGGKVVHMNMARAKVGTVVGMVGMTLRDTAEAMLPEVGEEEQTQAVPHMAVVTSLGRPKDMDQIVVAVVAHEVEPGGSGTRAGAFVYPGRLDIETEQRHSRRVLCLVYIAASA
jgi:hypothetical protein